MERPIKPDQIGKMTGSLHDDIEKRLAMLADGGPQAIEDRLAELDREWTAGRLTKATLGVLIVVGFALALVNLWWLIFPGIGGAILLQYLFMRTSVIGYAFYLLGYRSGQEVDQERMALKALRGDFLNVHTVHEVESREDVTRMEGEGGLVVDEEENAKVEPKEAAKEAIDATKS